MSNNEWIIVPGAASAYNDPTGHGTAVTSKICGQISGVAKRTTIIPVKINTDNMLSWTSMWTRTLNDIKQRREQGRGALPGKTVVNFSNEYGQAEDSFDIRRVKPILGEIMSLGVPIVVAAGNSRQEIGPAIVSAPAVWAASDFPLLVVSSVDRNFQASDFSQYGAQTSVWAVGEENVIAWPTGDADFRPNGSGTSYGQPHPIPLAFHCFNSDTITAAPQVAGLILYYMSLPDAIPFLLAQSQVAYRVWECFRSGYCAYPRRLSGLRVLCNLMDGTIRNQCGTAFKRSFNSLQERDGVCTLDSQSSGVPTSTVLDSNPTSASIVGKAASGSSITGATTQSSPLTTLSIAVSTSTTSQPPDTTSSASLSCSVSSNSGVATWDPPKVRTPELLHAF